MIRKSHKFGFSWRNPHVDWRYGRRAGGKQDPWLIAVDRHTDTRGHRGPAFDPVVDCRSAGEKERDMSRFDALLDAQPRHSVVQKRWPVAAAINGRFPRPSLLVQHLSDRGAAPDSAAMGPPVGHQAATATPAKDDPDHAHSNLPAFPADTPSSDPGGIGCLASGCLFAGEEPGSARHGRRRPA